MYEEWVEVKARRIRECLSMFHVSGAPVDLQTIAERVYRERLRRASKMSWMPIKDRFTDFKPSPFIKSFINYLVSRLVEEGYMIYGWLVEAYDRARVADTALDISRSRVYSVGIWNKFLEVSDGVRVCDPRVEWFPSPVRVEGVAGRFVVEARDVTRVSDEAVRSEAVFGSPATRAVYARRVVRVPSLEFLRDVCTWRNG
jgi:hypothetical protein